MIKTDLAIIGAGIAGVSAAVYARRAGLEFLLFEAKAVGGQLFFIDRVDNYVGIASGSKAAGVVSNLNGALNDLGIEPVAEEIAKVTVDKAGISISSEANNYSARSAIIATGASFKKLEVKGEEEFSGRGVSYCAICDGFFFKGKDVIVVGGGNTALEEALYLCDICRKVYLVHRRKEFRAMEYLQSHVLEKKNIEIIWDSTVEEIKGSQSISEVSVKNVKTNKTGSLAAQGVFIAVGFKPATSLFKEVIKLDEAGFIITDENMRTSLDYIWASGDCRRRPLRQLITAAAEGAIASLGAYKYLKGHYISA